MVIFPYELLSLSIQVEDEVDEINKTEFSKLEARLGETSLPVEGNPDTTTEKD